nr:MAG TPA: TIP39 peptide [Caudoviricetes sp.]
MKKLINHIRRWNIWRKHCLNSNFHKILVLFGVIKSPTMNIMLLPEERPNL